MFSFPFIFTTKSMRLAASIIAGILFPNHFASFPDGWLPYPKCHINKAPSQGTRKESAKAIAPRRPLTWNVWKELQVLLLLLSFNVFAESIPSRLCICSKWSYMSFTRWIMEHSIHLSSSSKHKTISYHLNKVMQQAFHSKWASAKITHLFLQSQSRCGFEHHFRWWVQKVSPKLGDVIWSDPVHHGSVLCGMDNPSVSIPECAYLWSKK